MSTAQELNKIQLESKSKGKGKASDDVSDTSSIAESEVESDLTEDESGDGEWVVDAIKWAKFKDSRPYRLDDGWIGWHYGVMWNGYLKTGWETEEPVKNFNIEKGKKSIVAEFWEEIGETIPPRKKEPKGRMNTVYETPSALLRRWFSKNPTKKHGIKYRRSYETYKRRRAKELKREKLEDQDLEVPDDLQTKKADSDHYLFKKQLKEHRQRQRALEANPSLKVIASAKNSKSPTPGSSKNDKPKVKTTITAARPPPPNILHNATALGSPASSLGSLFDSDKEGVEQELQAASSEEEQEQIEAPPSPSDNKPKSTKRKAPSASPVDETLSSTDINQNKRAKKEERAARLVNAGKLAKRVTSPPPSASNVTFGELQDGIFDLAPTSAPSPPAQAPIPVPAPASASTSVPTSVKAASSTAALAKLSTSAAPAGPSMSTSAASNGSSISKTISAPKPVMNAVQATLAALKSKQAASTTSPSVRQPPGGGKASSSPSIGSEAQLPVPEQPNDNDSTTVMPTAVVSKTASANNVTVNANPTALPVSNQVSSPVEQSSTLSGPVPGFNPAPVAASSKTRAAPSMINRPKYQQPSRIAILEEPTKPRGMRKPVPTGPNENRTRPPQPASIPARPANSFVPRQVYPLDPYGAGQFNESQPNGMGNSSPNLDLKSPTIPSAPMPTVNLPADPRRKAIQTTQITAESSLPTPVATPTQPQIPVEFSLKPVDVTGSLVTFSPSLILKSPGKFVNAMKWCITNPDCAVYLTPPAMEFINRAWPIRQLCPDPTTAFSVLVQFLPLDDGLREIAGAGITSGGGISISCCPPSPYQADACKEWKTWLYDVLQSTEYEELISLCETRNKGLGPAFNIALRDHDEGKIEQMQIDDLKKMKIRKDIVDYSRFIYVSEEKRINTTEGVDFLSVDEFIDGLSRGSVN
ncbi:uncharacterized protein L201_006013 [Kwoniella dendrophila CBS 6074]|uniref:Chromo domain-containing protein n=1 Tax=Kwoniella dendrophila CBS 6074 TaxID=1295534 RepID=A0AAX4K0J5_9TREE